MTGDIISFGEGRKPFLDAMRRIKAAKASLPEHDPHQDLLDALAAAVERIDATGQPLAPTASALNDEQVKSLTYQVERAAERGVGIYAKRIRSWHQAIVGGAFVTGLSFGLLGAGVMWFVTPTPPVLTYADQPDGSRIGYYFVRAPTQQPEAPTPAPAAQVQQPTTKTAGRH